MANLRLLVREMVRLGNEEPGLNSQTVVRRAMEVAGYQPSGLSALNRILQSLEVAGLVTVRNKRVYEGTTPDPQAVEQLESKVRQLQADLAAEQAKVASVRAEAEKAQPAVFEVVLKNGNGKVVRKGEADSYHPAFREVLVLATLREHIFLPGPAGCGKSHLAEQVARELGLRFGFISCSAGMSESQLLGRMIPAGEDGAFVFQTTEFLTCYEEGGVFLLDEIDAADANVLLILNSALANGHLAVPSRHGKPVAKKHKDFVLIAAANTFGTGADRQYVGRNQLDESTLDRFRVGTVPMDYDENLERKLVSEKLPGEPGERFYARMVRYRSNIRRARLPRILSTRFIIKAARLVAEAGWDDAKVDSKLFAGWRPEEVSKAKGV